MASNSFGTIFRITTWGESHGKAIGVVIDGCPAGVELAVEDIQRALDLRAPGKNPYTSPRQETDQAEILSGIFEGKTTGAPISILIPNRDSQSRHYEKDKDLLKPGHANFTYLEKYGIFDWRGSGRASARETACRVAAGAVAKKLLESQGIGLIAYLKQVGSIAASIGDRPEHLRERIFQNSIFCPDGEAAVAMMTKIEEAKAAGDSLGGVVEFVVYSLPSGLGDPVYAKLEANLASAMLSIPATKGFEIGSGFEAAAMLGSEHNDLFAHEDNTIKTATNHAGGTLGGISTGMPVVARVAFKPPSTIGKQQSTLTRKGDEAVLQVASGARHDPCVAIRAVPVVEAMASLVIADALLLQRCARL